MYKVFTASFKFNNVCIFPSQFARCLSSSEVAAALRPFYFAVHPDLFWQHPREKEVNENSLKLLKVHLDKKDLHREIRNPTKLTFYLRKTIENGDDASTGDFTRLTFHLFDDVKATIHGILKTSKLSTDYIDKLSQKQKSHDDTRSNVYTNDEFIKKQEFTFSRIKFAEMHVASEKKKQADQTLSSWLTKNMRKSYRLLLKTNPVRDEIARLCHLIVKQLCLADIIWDCGYGLAHHRGCLQSFCNLMKQHQHAMDILRGRTIVFGTQTGVSLDGHIILSIEDVRHSWLDLIKSVGLYNDRLKNLPEIERSLSRCLRRINIVHRKYQPAVTIQSYEKRLNKLTSILQSYKLRGEFPRTWPMSLDKFELVVESESGPLMLSPTGQFIAPSSCPAFLLINYITKHLDEASQKLTTYRRMKRQEDVLTKACKDKFQLASLEKDDNVTPDLMTVCCERLLIDFPIENISLAGYRLLVTHYYSVQQDGDLCIPWNWKL